VPQRTDAAALELDRRRTLESCAMAAGDEGEKTFNGDLAFGNSFAGERRLLPREALIAHITTLLQSCEGCEKVAVIGITALDAPDEAGCNWSSTLVLDPAGVAAEVYTLAYAGIIGMARERWNLQ